jgi:tetratricopeptide (TPR) repeat protein
MHHRQGNVQAAEADYRHIIEHSTDGTPDAALALAYNNLAWLLLTQRRDATQALPLAEKAVELLSPTMAPYPGAAVHGTRASVYNALGRYDEAIADYDEALKHEPDEAGHYFRRGGAWYARGYRERALAECDHTVQRGLDVALLQEHDLFDILQGRLHWALAYYERMHQLRPDDARVFVGCGDAYRLNGYTREAIASYTEALRRDPALADAYIGRGHAYTCQGDLVHALDDFGQAHAYATKPHQRREATMLLDSFGAPQKPLVPETVQSI